MHCTRPGNKRPIDCLIEIGLDKLRKDYLKYIAGNMLTELQFA